MIIIIKSELRSAWV